jgi:UDP-glucose 6-dehydrogenase
LKSIVFPSVLEQMSLEIHNLVYNAEFLREKHAGEDFINPNMILTGSKNNDAIIFLENFY